MANAVLCDPTATGSGSFLEYDLGSATGTIWCQAWVYFAIADLSATAGSAALMQLSPTPGDSSASDAVQYIQALKYSSPLTDWFWYLDNGAPAGLITGDPGWHLLRLMWDTSGGYPMLGGADGLHWHEAGNDFSSTVRALQFGAVVNGASGSVGDIWLGHVQIGTTPGGSDVLDWDPATAPDLSAWSSVVGSCTLASPPAPQPAALPTVAGDVTLKTGNTTRSPSASNTTETSLLFQLPGSGVSAIYVEAVVQFDATALALWNASSLGAQGPDIVSVCSNANIYDTDEIEATYPWRDPGPDITGWGDEWDGNLNDDPSTVDAGVFHTIKIWIDASGDGYYTVDGHAELTFTGVTGGPYRFVRVGYLGQVYFGCGTMVVQSVKIGSTDGGSDYFDYDPSTPAEFGAIDLATLPVFAVNYNFNPVGETPGISIPTTVADLQNTDGERVLSFELAVTNNTNVDPSGGGGNLRFFEGFQWRFIVTDLQLRTTTWADGLWTDRAIAFNLNQPTVITAGLHPDDFRVNGLWTDGYPRVSQSNRIVWCYRRDGVNGDPPWNLRAAGILMSPDDQGDPDVPLTHLTAYDPWQLLRGRPCMFADGSLPASTGPGPTGMNFCAGGVCSTGDQIALQLLKNSIENEGGCFIDAGTAWGGTPEYDARLAAGKVVLETTPIIDLHVDAGQMVGDVWDNLCQAGNLDIVLTPIYDPSRSITPHSDGETYYFTHELNIYSLAGKYRPNARFTWNRLNRSAANVERMHDATPGAFFDKVQYYAGQGGPPVPAEGPLVNADALAAFGSYWATQFWPEQTATTIVDAPYVLALATQALTLAKQGTRTITITTIPERAPIPILGYQVGDFVPIYISDALRVESDGYQRVQTIPVAIDDDGIETVAGLVTSPDWREPINP